MKISNITLFCFITSMIFMACGKVKGGEGLDALLKPLELKAEPERSRSEQTSEKTVIIKEEEKSTVSTFFKLTSTEITLELARLLKEKYETEGELKVSFIKAFDDIELNSADWKLEIRDYPANGLSPTNVISFLLTEKGKEIGKWRVAIKCELWKEVFLSKYAITRGKPISDNDFKTQLIDVLLMRKNFVSTSTDLKLYETIQGVSSDKPLTWSDISKIPTIRKGDIVEIIAEEGLMKLSTKGMALENGCKGDLISVRNIQSSKNIEGQVINEKSVKVHF